MSAQVTAALISSGAALAVALLGIAGAIAAQLVATRRAFANSLALSERQHAAQEATRKQERADAARREDAYRYAGQRKSTYARFLGHHDELVAARDTSRAFRDLAREAPDEHGGEPLPPESAEYADQVVRDSIDRAGKARRELEATAGEIDLIGSAEVRKAAELLLDTTRWETVARARPGARAAFLDAARRELALTDDQ
jgi:hypothetical protein